MKIQQKCVGPSFRCFCLGFSWHWCPSKMMLLSTLAFTPLATTPPQSPWNDNNNNNSDRHLWETYSRGVVVANVPSVGMLLLRMLQLLLSPPFGIWPSNNNPGHGTTTEIFFGGSGSSSDSAAAAAALSAGSWVFALLLCVQVVTKVVLASHAWFNNLTFYSKNNHTIDAVRSKIEIYLPQNVEEVQPWYALSCLCRNGVGN